MKIANSDGRAVIVLGDEIADVAEISGGKFGPDPMSLYKDWAAFTDFASTVSSGTRTARAGRAAQSGARSTAGVRHRHQLPQPR